MAGRVLRFVRNVAGYVMGDPWEEGQQGEQRQSGHSGAPAAHQGRGPAQPPPTAGFSHRVPVPRERQGAARRVPAEVEQPVLMESQGHNGGVQGFQWYADELRRDSDGDVACSFLEESPDLADHRGSDTHTNAAAASANSTAVKSVGAGSENSRSPQERKGLGRDRQARQPLVEVPLQNLQPLGPCPIVCCIDGNLAHSLGPSQQVGFA